MVGSRYAAVDLAAADALLELDRDDIDPWVMAFHAQQAAEKAVKALLLSLEIEYPRTHDLATLLSRLPWELVDRATPGVAGLTVFSVGMRYPTASWDPLVLDDQVDDAEALAAVEIARQFMDQVRSIVADGRAGLADASD
jgi:HEPN domain-containing protein